MNMQKLGTLGQSEIGFRNRSNPMNTVLRAIHYANIRIRQSGMVRGMVARFTYLRLSGLPPFGRNELINFESGVTRSHSFQKKSL